MCLSEALELIPHIKLEVLAWFRQLEGLGELVWAEDLIGFPGAPAGWDVLDAFRRKDNRLAIRRNRLHYILVDKPFGMELPVDERFSRLIIAEETKVLVNFTLRVLALR